MNKTLQALTLALSLTACKPREVKPSDYSGYFTTKLQTNQANMTLRDIDNDGLVDVLTVEDNFSPTAYLVAQDAISKLHGTFSVDVFKQTPRMSPELRKKLSDDMKLQRTLAYEVDRTIYDQTNKGKK